MNPVFRKILFRFLTLFFVIFVPILIFAILGFDFNFSQKKIINSMDITMETLPRNADITTFGKNIGQTPSSLKIEAGNYLDLELKKENFLTEKFGFVGLKNENTNIRLSNLQLLPTQAQIIAKIQEPSKNQATGSPLRENLTILSEIILWTTNLPKLAVQKNIKTQEENQGQDQTNQNSTNLSPNTTKNILNSFNSPNNSANSQNKPDLVNSIAMSNSSIYSQNSPIQKIESKLDLENNQNKQNLEQKEQIIWAQNFTLTGLIGSSKKVSKISQRNFESGGIWQNIGKSYWNKDTDWLIFAQDNNWNLVDLKLINPIKSLVQINNQSNNLQFLMLDNSGNLWLWKLDNFDELNRFQNNSTNSLQNNISNQNSDQKQNPSSQSSSQNEQNNFQNKYNSDQKIEQKTDLQNLFHLEFLESSVCQMSFLETKTIWIVQNSQIFRLESGRIENWNLEKNFFAINKFGLLGNSCSKFEVKSFLQGYIFLIDQSLWFLPDSDRRNWLVLANLVDSFETFEESLFWQSGQNLYNYNSITGLEKYLGQIEINAQKQNTVMFYDFNWRRLMIYTTGKNTDKNNFSINSNNSQNLKNPQNTQKIANSDSTNLNQVWSVWFDKSNPSSQNIIFYPKIWLENKNCLNKIQDQLQFCLQDENLIIYGNFDFF